MERIKSRKQKLMIGLAAFMLLMWLCTLISKSIYASGLPIVTVQNPEGKYVEHQVEAEGVVEAAAKRPVTAISGIRVESVAVRKGDQVAEGDLLFTVDLTDLEQMIEGLQSERSEIQVQLNTLLANKELAAKRKEKEEERAREDYDTLARYQDTLVGRAKEEIAKIEEDMENLQEEGGKYSEEWERLQDELQAAAYAEADARGNRDQLMKEAERQIEDILWPEDVDVAASLYQMNIDELNEEISAYQSIADARGQILAESSGIITDLFISVGSRIPDTAVMLLADDTVPYEFLATLSAEQKRYMGIGDEVTLDLGGRFDKMRAVVEYLAEDENMPGVYLARIPLPEGIGIPGMSGTVIRVETGEWRECCIPVHALHTVNNRSFVYIVQEKEGILGKEYCAQSIDVRVLDQNENFAALEMTLPSDSMIIVSSTAEFANGDIVKIS